MNLDIMHNTYERKVKDYFRKTGQWYKVPEGMEYEYQIRELGKNIYTYLLSTDPDKARHWTSTNTYDFE